MSSPGKLELDLAPHLMSSGHDDHDMTWVLRFEDEGPDIERDRDFDIAVHEIRLLNGTFAKGDDCYKYFVLVYSLHHDGEFDLNTLRPADPNVKISELPVVRDAGSICGVSPEKITIDKLWGVARSLTKYITRCTETGNFIIKSKAVMEAILLSYAEHFLSRVLQELCSRRFLHQYVTTQETRNVNIPYNNYAIEVHPAQYEAIVVRFVNDIIGGNVATVAYHPTMAGPRLIEDLIVYCKKEDKLRELLRASDFRSKPGRPMSLLYCLIAQPIPKVDMLRRLLKEGYDEVVGDEDLANRQKAFAMQGACRWGHWDCFRYLVDIVPSNLIDFTCLRCAVIGGRQEILEHLLREKTWTQEDMDRALQWACNTGLLSTYLLLKRSGAVTTDMCLFEAAYGGSLDILGDVVENVEVDLPVHGSETALFAAARRGHGHVVDYLLQVGSQPDMKSENGRTALLEAARAGYRDVIEILLCAGADAQATDNNGDNALHAACAGGHIEVLEFMRQFLSDLSARNKFGRSLLLNCGLGGNVEVFQYLLENGCDIKETDEAGNNILHFSCMNGRNELSEAVLAKDPGLISETNTATLRPIHYAALAGHSLSVKLLWRLGESFSGDRSWLDLARNGIETGNEAVIQRLESELAIGIVRGTKGEHSDIVSSFQTPERQTVVG